jgi:RNA polymerase sigma-70 factor (ECF subfamily)
MNARDTQLDSDERELVRAAQRGDLAAFKALYERFRDQMYNLTYYWLGDAVWAEDVLQIIFMKAYRGLPDFRFESGFATWLYRIALNECRNQQQRRGAQPVPLEALLGSDSEFDAAPPPDFEQAVRERREIIHRALMELPPKLRAVVALKYLDGLSYEEIATVLGCAPGTVASRLNRALAKLEARLRPLRRLL